jgi:ParB-like chromosome segregation protein Spo0J
MELKQHPLSAAFPSMSEADFQALKDDIDNNGQREPVIVLDGMVLDGWHRYRACSELGLPVEKFTFKDGADPVAFVLSTNLHRRHLSASQRAAAVVACTAWAPAHREKKVEAASTLSTNDQMAKAAGTTVRTITDAKAAHKAGLGEAVKDGAVTAEEAAKIARGKPSAPAKKQEVAPLDDGPSVDEVAASKRAAAEELEALRRLALSDDKLSTAIEENKQLRAMNRVLTERLNEQMNKANELIRRIKTLQKKLDKYEKEPA